MTRSKDLTFRNQSFKHCGILRRLLQGLHSKCGNNSRSWRELSYISSAATRNVRFAFPKNVLQWAEFPTDFQSLQELVTFLDAARIFFVVFEICPRSSCCDTWRMCYIFRQIFPFSPSFLSSGKTKVRPGYTSFPLCFCHLPLFGRHVTSLNPRSFWGGRRKTLGTRLNKIILPHSGELTSTL